MKLVAYTPDGKVKTIDVWPDSEVEITPIGIRVNNRLELLGQGYHGWTDQTTDKYERYIKIVVES